MRDYYQGANTLYIVSPPTENRTELVCSMANSALKAGIKHKGVELLPTSLNSFAVTY